MNEINCDSCNSSLLELDPYQNYKHTKCVNCGLERFVCVDTLIESSIYENDADYIDDLNITKNSEDLILWHHSKAITFLEKKFQSGHISSLDIGCFNGFFVKKLLTLGYDAHGIDFNKDAISFGKQKLKLESRISTESIETLISLGNKYNAITLFEVLEHLNNTNDFLSNVCKLLKEDGVLIISTPNNKMCWRPALDYPPHHLSRFTTKSISGYLTQIGLKTVYSSEQMSCYELIRHYVGSFFRAKDNPSLRGGEFKNKNLTTILRRIMNKLRKLLNILFLPIDKMLYILGLRYISLLVIAEKSKTLSK